MQCYQKWGKRSACPDPGAGVHTLSPLWCDVRFTDALDDVRSSFLFLLCDELHQMHFLHRLGCVFFLHFYQDDVSDYVDFNYAELPLHFWEKSHVLRVTHPPRKPILVVGEDSCNYTHEGHRSAVFLGCLFRALGSH